MPQRTGMEQGIAKRNRAITELHQQFIRKGSPQMNPETLCGMGRVVVHDEESIVWKDTHEDGSLCDGPACQPTDGEIVEALETGKWTIFAPRLRRRYPFVDDGLPNWSLVHPDRGRIEAPTLRLAITAAIKAERGRKG